MSPSIKKTIKSKWFGAICYALLAFFAAAVAYDWLSSKGRTKLKMNVSGFAFRDANRNGIYDIADRPFAGMNFSLDRPRGRTVSARSNLWGFANFKMKYKGDDVPIKDPGLHIMTAHPPEGWIITTGNQVQTSAFRKLEGSPLGMVADRTYRPVGIAPILNVSGSVQKANAGDDSGRLTLEAVGDKGGPKDVRIHNDGQFAFEAEPGLWTLNLRLNGRVIKSLDLHLESYPVYVSSSAFHRNGNAEKRGEGAIKTIGFDNLTLSDTIKEIPSGYGGLNWNNWVAAHQYYYGNEGHVNGVVSSEYLAYTSSGHPATIESEKEFDLRGFYAALDRLQGEQHRIRIKAWRRDKLAYEDSFFGSSSAPIAFIADFSDITKLEVSNDLNWHVSIDDFQFQWSDGAAD